MTTLIKKTLRKRITKWLSNTDNVLLIAEWIIRAVSWYCGLEDTAWILIRMLRLLLNNNNKRGILKLIHFYT